MGTFQCYLYRPGCCLLTISICLHLSMTVMKDMFASSDSIDTPSALRLMQDLVKQANIYISTKKDKKESPNHQLIEGIAKYLTRMLKVRL